MPETLSKRLLKIFLILLNNTAKRVIKLFEKWNDKTLRINEKIEDGARIAKETSRAKRDGGLAGKRKWKTYGSLKGENE